MPVTGSLSWQVITVAAINGVFRQIAALKNHQIPGKGLPYQQGWTESIHGTIAEAAFAYACDRFPNYSSRPDYDGDICGQIEVRGTTHHKGHLLLYDTDFDDRPYVLVTIGQLPQFRLAGWIWGREGKHRQWYDTEKFRVPCYAVPQEDLYDITVLETARAGLVKV